MNININFRDILQNVFCMAIAYLLAMQIAWDR